MSRKIIISKTAEKKLSQLFSYLIQDWSVQVRDDFIKRLDHHIEIIKKQPEIFPESRKGKGLRKCVITKHTILFYRFNSRQITIVTIFDSRQDPAKI